MEVLLEPVTIDAVPWDWLEVRRLEAKVVDDFVEETVELDAVIRDEELGVIVAEGDVARVVELEELVLVDVVVEDIEDEVVFAL